MALPNIKEQIIATGANVEVRVGVNSATPEKTIGLATNVSYSENFQVQDAVVIGHLGPVSIDPNGYNCEITIGTFIPAKRVTGSKQYEGGGSVTLSELLPTRTDVMEAGKPKGFQYLDFYNKKEKVVLAAFSGVIVTDDGMNIDGNAYAKANIQLRALERTL